MVKNKESWKQLRYVMGSIKTSLESVNATAKDGLSDLTLPDDRYEIIFSDLQKDVSRWIQAMESNIGYCKKQEGL